MDKSTLTTLFQKFGEIRMPSESDEPILAPGPRYALHEWLRELSSQDELKTHGITPRTKALLFGPPGTGKTTMAHHLSARLGLPMLCVGSETLITSALGGSSKNIAALYGAIQQARGQISVFFDEVDSIAGKRTGGDSCSNELASTLNVLLRCIERDKTITFAATNRHDMLDTALWRRFDMQIHVDLPGADERYPILKRYIAPLDPTEHDLEVLTDATEGASPDLCRRLMEGIKRARVLWPKLGRDFADAAAVFASLTSSISPPPELQTIPLWNEPDTFTSQLQWSW